MKAVESSLFTISPRTTAQGAVSQAEEPFQKGKRGGQCVCDFGEVGTGHQAPTLARGTDSLENGFTAFFLFFDEIFISPHRILVVACGI